MKKILFFMLFLVICFTLFAQENKAKISDFKNIRKLENKEEEEVSVEIRKPDNDALMPRKQTSFKYEKKIVLREKMKHANKKLY
jgi:hypothetical protein